MIRWISAGWRALREGVAVWRLRRELAQLKLARFDEVAGDAAALYHALDSQRLAYNNLVDQLASTQTELDQLRGEFAGLAARRALDGPALDDAVARRLFDALEPLLVQAPALRAAVEQGTDVSARDALDLLAPLDQLLADLGVAAIGVPGVDVPYDPARHRVVGAGDAPPAGTLVRVRFPGYTRGGEVLRRADVMHPH